MGSDRARRSFDATRMYRSVVPQQGRVTLEADANEADEIRTAESRAELVDIIGPAGTPDDGFLIAVPGGTAAFDFAIAAGTIYVGGERVVQAAAGTYLGQSAGDWVDYPAGAPTAYPTAPLTEVVFLAITEHDVSATEDRVLREVALGGPDTAARTRLVQRVQRAPATGTDCESSLAAAIKAGWPALAFDLATSRLNSKARLLVDFTPVPTDADPCQPTAQAGFLGADNQLIRVQVTSDGSLLWGYDNASFLYRATVQSATTVALVGTIVDAHHVPLAQQWVEVLAPAVSLDADARIAAATGEGRALVGYNTDTKILTLAAALPAGFAVGTPVFVRVWQNHLAFVGDGTTPTALVDFTGASTGVRVTTTGPAAPGDYWLIGVRPSNPTSILPARLTGWPQPPDGPARWATSLATIAWNAGGRTATVHDCRAHFDPLICDDLAFHNQHLHGWGVVCGLQVRCMVPTYATAHALPHPLEWVTVHDGYAIDPTGHDIVLRAMVPHHFTPLALGDLAVTDGTLTRNAAGKLADGAISLWVDRHGGFHTETYDPAHKPTATEFLDGTLLLDIYNDCIKKVLDFVRGALTASSPTTTALVNLFWQLLNPNTGTAIYLSGEPNPTTEPADKEDALLRAFFTSFKALLQSKCFCAMFDDLVYPDYNVYQANLPAGAVHPTTIFGKHSHARIRVHPRASFALTCGVGSQIDVFDLNQNKLVASVDFPAAVAQVDDVAFATTGMDVYAIGTPASGTNTVFARGTLQTNGAITWVTQAATTYHLATLATLDGSPGVVYAAAVATGICKIDPTSIAASPTLIQQFKATPHLVAGNVPGQLMLYAGDSSESTAGNAIAFATIRGINVASPDGVQTFRLPQAPGAVNVTGRDDLAVVRSADGATTALYAIIDAATAGEKQLAIWDLGKPGPPRTTVALEANANGRVAYSSAGNWSLITYEDSNVGHGYVPGATSMQPGAHPLQISPTAVATDAAGKWFYVLEHGSNTITAIPALGVAATPAMSTIDIPALQKYRSAAIAVFLKAAGRFVQYLKDCVCDHLMVHCPKPDGKKVYLADISFKNGEVYQICNFHHRKYVHTFPTVEYWMSLVPILPLLKYEVEQLCCSVLGGIFDKYATNGGDDKLTGAMWDNARAYLSSANIKSTIAMRKSQLSAGIELARQTASTAIVGSLTDVLKTAAPPPTSSIVNQPVAAASKAAAAGGLTVRGVVPFGPMSTAFNVAVANFHPGDTVDLVTDSTGSVIGLAKVPAPPPTVAVAAPAVATVADVAALKTNLASMHVLHQQQTATIAAMQTQIATLTKSLAAITK